MKQRLEVKLLIGNKTIVDLTAVADISQTSPTNPIEITDIDKGVDFVNSYQPFNGVQDLYLKLSKKGEERSPQHYQIQIKAKPRII